MYEIIFSEESLNDIDEIKAFIELDNRIISEKVVSSIMNTIQYLSVFPQLGVLKNGDSREIVESVYKYKIRYKLINNLIYIFTIYKYQNK
ncbi:MAG: type II toxin-antitoxin system RelE/ParE family toxin [Candidatus Gracilibacteria bacterium]|nr:type II toxin-antitoxin system RelE/ParE family toxin [Candidatus Gracilibacteria bacterium]